MRYTYTFGLIGILIGIAFDLGLLEKGEKPLVKGDTPNEPEKVRNNGRSNPGDDSNNQPGGSVEGPGEVEPGETEVKEDVDETDN